MIRRLSLLTLILFFYHISVAFSQIAIDQVAPGPYTPESSIAATFSLGSPCLQPGNLFNLYLVSPSGVERLIGSYSGFYSTFVNGIIPLGTPIGTGYKLRVKSTLPALTSSDSSPFEIRAGVKTIAAINSSSKASTNPLTFGTCNTDENTPTKEFFFDNESGTGNVAVTFKDELNPGVPQTKTFGAAGTSISYNAALAHYTLFVKATQPDGTMATKAYLLINNLAVTAFTTTSGNTVCFPVGTFEYKVDITKDGIGVNFPGNIYRIDWGDGTFNDYTYCDIKQNNSRISHTYSKSSCGLSYQSGNQTFYNAFGVNVGLISPFCGAIGSPLSTPAKVVTRPENLFSFPPIACINDDIIFNNKSLPGEQANTNSPGCAPNNVKYNWYVDNALVASAKPLSYNLVHKFTTTGKHKIRLSSISDGNCQADDFELEICVQERPKPSFTLPANLICLSSGVLTPDNKSILDETSCPSTPVYTWNVVPAQGVTYSGGTSKSSKTPQFKFDQVGVYDITLSIKTGTCQEITLPQQVVVNSAPQATLSPEKILCQNGDFVFGPNATDTKTVISGTAKDLADTYTWEVIGAGAYSFVAPSTANSKYPVIHFADFDTYTIKLTHKNNCGTITVTQKITFTPAPAPTITANTIQICNNASVSLTGAISGSYRSFTWDNGVNSTGFSAPNSLTTTYTPTAAEREAGLAKIYLRVNTGLTGDCATVFKEIDITILPENKLTNPGNSKSICTGTSVAFTPTSTVSGSTFSWTATNADGNAVAGSYSATGSGPINDVIINTSSTANAVVAYTITPTANGCPGTPFILTVTVTPKPILTATATKPIICSGGQAGINLSSNIAAPTLTYYTWTRTSVAGISGNPDQTTPVAVTSIDEILTSTATTNISVTYTITPQLQNGCPGTPIQVSVTVRPPVTGNTVTGVPAICRESMPAQLVGSLPSGGDGIYFYQWQLSPDGNTWTDISNANAQNYQPGILTETTYYRRGISTAACSGIQSLSVPVKVTINPNAKAEYTYGNTLSSCAPFALPITAVLYPDRNDTYTWVINANGNITQSAGPVFPGYTMQNPNERVIVKLVVTSSLGCANNEFSQEFTTIQKNVPSFTPVTTVNCGPTPVSFVNTSIQNGDTSFKWDFGNGETSNFVTPPAVTFNPSPSGKDTTYVVTLYAITLCGTDSVKGSVLIKSEPKPIFSPSETSVCSPALITFTNNSPLQSGTRYSFDFGDGSPILETNDRSSVTHVYRATTATLHFNASMTAVNSCGTKTTEPYIIEVRPNNVNAELVVNGNQKRGCAPFKVTFSNNSTGADQFSVDFNDGTQPRQSILSPERFDYTFTRPGIYNVMLIASSHNCARDTTYEEIEVLAQPMPAFEANITQGCPGLQVQFKNTTQDTNITGFIWDFGDGTPTFTGVEPPVHTYTGDQEYYTVTLTATNALGCSNTEIKAEYIHITQPPLALFNVDPSIQISIPNYTFKFIDESQNNPDQWVWDFGDGSGSSERNPSHTYADTGLYKVTLKVINQSGCFTTSFKNVRINGVPGYLFVPNSFIPGSESSELRQFKAKGSGIKSWRMSIFNKWGQLIWETTKLDDGHPQEGWDGTYHNAQLPQSVYYWKIDVQFINGSEWKGMTYNNSAPKRTGAIHLIR